MYTNRSNMAMDGAVIMQPQAHMDWYCQSLLMLSRSLLRQLPSSYQVQMDSAAFLRSISFLNGSQRQHSSPWSLAPDPPVHEPSSGDSQTTASTSGAMDFDEDSEENLVLEFGKL